MKALDIVDTLVKSAAVDMVVVDSVAALVPKAELEGEMGDHHIALQVYIYILKYYFCFYSSLIIIMWKKSNDSIAVLASWRRR